MAGSLEGNKIFAAMLTAGIIGVGSGVLAGILYHPHAARGAGLPGRGAASRRPAARRRPRPRRSRSARCWPRPSAEEGEKAAKKCAACHNFDHGRRQQGRPGAVGRGQPADRQRTRASATPTALAGKSGEAWDYDHLNQFLHQPEDLRAGHQDGLRRHLQGRGARRRDRLPALARRQPAPLPERLTAAAHGRRAVPRVRGAGASAGRPRRRGPAPLLPHRRSRSRPSRTRARSRSPTARPRRRCASSSARPSRTTASSARSTAASALDAEFVWVLDPIDGTKSFITGRPLFGTLIALAHARPAGARADRPVDPARALGRRRRRADRPGTAGRSRVRACPRLERRGAVRHQPATCSRPGPERGASTGSRDRVRLPIYGGDCYAYGLLAMGFADLVVETGLQPYDFMALAPVIEGAGGRITDWAGPAARARLVGAGGGRRRRRGSHAAACARSADAALLRA